MFIVHELTDGYICKVDGETPNIGDVLCLNLYRVGTVYFKVKKVVRYAEQSTNESMLSTHLIKAMVERITI